MKSEKQFQVKLPAELADEFEAVVSMTGVTKSAIVQQAIESYVSRYENSDGKFVPKPGKYFRHTMRNEDGTIHDDEVHCMILGSCMVMGAPYMAIFEGGSVYKVPAKSVQYL